MNQQKSVYHYSFEELDRELIARGAQKMKQEGSQWKLPNDTPEEKLRLEQHELLYQSPPKPSEELKGFTDAQLVERLKYLSRGQIKNDTADNHKKAIIGEDDRMDAFEVEEMMSMNSHTTSASAIPQTIDAAKEREKIKKIITNLNAVGMICFEDSLERKDPGVNLKVESYRKKYSLCPFERFSNQPIAFGFSATCFLVSEDIIATASHFALLLPIERYRILFGFKMQDSKTATTQVPKENLYRAVEIIGQEANEKDGKGSDWALVRLDRPVSGRNTVALFTGDISKDQSIYTIGHPVGLPLKFAAGAHVHNNEERFLFSADLDVYMNNSGSPVFDRETHKLIGLVVQGYSQDFRPYNHRYISVLSPEHTENAPLSQCTRLSPISDRLKTYKSEMSLKTITM